jgi:hypothetical protein
VLAFWRTAAEGKEEAASVIYLFWIGGGVRICAICPWRRGSSASISSLSSLILSINEISSAISASIKEYIYGDGGQYHHNSHSVILASSNNIILYIYI